MISPLQSYHIEIAVGGNSLYTLDPVPLEVGWKPPPGPKRKQKLYLHTSKLMIFPRHATPPQTNLQKTRPEKRP